MKELKFEMFLFFAGIASGMILYYSGFYDFGLMVAAGIGIVSIMLAGVHFFNESVKNGNIYFTKDGMGINKYDVFYLGRNESGQPYVLKYIQGEKAGTEGLYCKFTKTLHKGPKFILQQHNGNPITFYYIIGKKQAIPVELITHIATTETTDKDGNKISRSELRALFPLFDLDAYKDLTDEKVAAEKAIRSAAAKQSKRSQNSWQDQVVASGVIVGAALVLAIVILNFSMDQADKSRTAYIKIAGKTVDMGQALLLCQKNLAFENGLLNLTQTPPTSSADRAIDEVADALTGG